MNAERLHKTFLDLCRIPSPSGMEKRIASWIRRFVEELGGVVVEDPAGSTGRSDALPGDGTGNLYIRPPAATSRSEQMQTPLFLCAHMDTVSVPFVDKIPVRVEGERVDTGGVSPLGGDDKAGVAIALELLASAIEHPDRLLHPLEVILTVQEEVGVRGGRLIDPERVAARQGFNLDGETPVYSAVSQGPFKLRFSVDVHGKSSHAALNPREGINAVKVAATMIERLATGVLDEQSTANIGRIEGGGATNVVPDQCTFTGELRSLTEQALTSWKQEYESIVTATARQAGARAAVAWEELYQGYHIDESEPCISLFRDSVRRTGHDSTLEVSRGGGDANYLNAKGLRCIVLGLGMERIHSPNEFYLLSRLREAATLLEHVFFSPA